MTSKSKKTFSRNIYVFGFSREEVLRAYNLFFEHEESKENFPELLIELFGKKPYSFANPELMYHPAPAKEFGVTHLSKKVLDTLFKMLPDYIQEIVAHRKDTLGFFVDEYGRYYKHEGGLVWSSYSPFLLRHHNGTKPLLMNEPINLTHTTAPDLNLRLYTEGIEGSQREVTYSVIVAQGDWTQSPGLASPSVYED